MSSNPLEDVKDFLDGGSKKKRSGGGGSTGFTVGDDQGTGFGNSGITLDSRDIAELHSGATGQPVTQVPNASPDGQGGEQFLLSQSRSSSSGFGGSDSLLPSLPSRDSVASSVLFEQLEAIRRRRGNPLGGSSRSAETPDALASTALFGV